MAIGQLKEGEKEKIPETPEKRKDALNMGLPAKKGDKDNDE